MGEEAGSRMRRQDRTILWRRSNTTNGIDGENFGGRRLEAKGGKKGRIGAIKESTTRREGNRKKRRNKNLSRGGEKRKKQKKT